jgi:hypothetical protein
MCEPRDLTPLEAAVVRMLAKAPQIPCDNIQADFLIRAFSNPTDLVTVVFNAVDWSVIAAHVEQRTC